MLRPISHIRSAAVTEVILWLLPGALIALLGDLTWGLGGMLAGALYVIVSHLRPYFSLAADHHVHIESSRCIRELQQVLDGVPRSHTAAIRRLEQLHRSDRRRLRKLERKLAELQKA